MRVVLADSEDAEAIASLRAAWRGHPVVEAEFVGQIVEWLLSEADRRTVWLAVDADRAVGMVSLVEFRRMPDPAGRAAQWGYVSHLFVRPEDRNAGIGTALLATLIAESEARDYQRLVLSPSTQAKPLFHRAGFGEADSASGHLLFVRPAPLAGRASAGRPSTPTGA